MKEIGYEMKPFQRHLLCLKSIIKTNRAADKIEQIEMIQKKPQKEPEVIL